jgi:hypothetical protein
LDPENLATPEPSGPNIQVHQSYPSKEEIVDRAIELDNGYNSRRTYENALGRLRKRHGEVAAARVGQTTWVYYPEYFPDPAEASYVLVGGEKRDPDPAKLVLAPSAEDQVMADGGSHEQTD